ncbi:MAG TPA: MMPL family transporter [Solirubrobacteraceae bacterium]|nr:MMPL family transporter [Solirubrobacteraceae bacterium]
MLAKLAGLVTRRSKRILIIAGLFFVVAAVVGGPVAGQLSAEDEDFQDPSAQNIVASKQLHAAAGDRQDSGLVALFSPGRDIRTDPTARAKLREIERTIEADPGVAGARSYLDTRDPAFISRNGRQTVVIAAFTGDELSAAHRLREKLAPDAVKIGGPDVVSPEIGDQVSSDLARAELIAFPLLFLLSLWVFRSLVAALLPPLVGALSIVTTFLLMRFVDSSVTSLSIYALNLVTGIGLGLAIDYSLFIVSRYREELAGGADRTVAIRRTLQTAGRTVFFSSLTVAAALASLLVFPLRFLYSMGIGGLIVALVAMAVALTVLPAVLFALGPRVNAGAPRFLRRAAEKTARPTTSGGWYRLAQWVMGRPAAVAIVTAGVLIVAGLPFLRIAFVPADYRMLPQGSEARQVAAAIDRGFTAFAAQPIEVVATATRAQDGQVDRYTAALRQVPGAGSVSAPQRLNGDTVLIDVLPPGDALSKANREVVRDVRAVPAPVPVAVGGAAARFVDQQDTLKSYLPYALGLLVLTTFALLFLFTGSVILPLKALLMNALTLSATFGILVLIFQDGRLEGVLDFTSAGGVEATQPVLLFAIAFGLATDYAVFLLSRIKEAHDRGLDDRSAVAFGVERTGRIVTAAALLFCVAIGAFATSGILFIKLLGVGTALAVAIDATVIRALLVPALMALLGPWNWWAPGPLRRLHARFGLSEAAA